MISCVQSVLLLQGNELLVCILSEQPHAHSFMVASDICSMLFKRWFGGSGVVLFGISGAHGPLRK